MKELRCIVFTDREVVTAVVDRRRRINEPLPDGLLPDLEFTTVEGKPMGHLRTRDGQTIEFGEQELQAALVAFCMARQIPLPVDAEKVVHLIKGKLTLMVTMNFQKGARLISARVAEELDDKVR